MKVVVIGGGVAGMFCAINLAKNGNKVILVEKNQKLGKKMFITGKGRCNITNACDRQEFLSNVVGNSKFLMSAINKFSPQDTINFFENQNLPIKIERGGRVFPQSDKSNDVIKCLEKCLEQYNVEVLLDNTVKEITTQNNAINSIIIDKNQELICDAVVIATGGVSYASTGSTGDGYKFAKKMGHNIVELKPALIPILLKNSHNLAGVSLKNIGAKIIDNNNKVIAQQFGEMLWTHTGVSGPVVLSMSSYLNKHYSNGKFNNKFWFCLDLKPALDCEKMEQKLLREFQEKKNIILKNYLPTLTLSAFVDVILEQSNISGQKQLNSITKEERTRLVNAIKELKFQIIGFENINASIITSGGVDTKEINPKDMQSKIIKNLYFAGEVMDVDALTGGFNIQIAFSTAFLVAEALKNT